MLLQVIGFIRYLLLYIYEVKPAENLVIKPLNEQISKLIRHVSLTVLFGCFKSSITEYNIETQNFLGTEMLHECLLDLASRLCCTSLRIDTSNYYELLFHFL